MSKVFTFTPDFDTAINADEIITGGTGYKDFGSLPPEIEARYRVFDTRLRQAL